MTVDVHAHAIIPRYHDLLDGLGVAAPGYGSAAVWWLPQRMSGSR